MARRSFGLLLAAAALAAGCQSTNVAALPKPNFTGPLVNAPPAALHPAAVAIAPVPVQKPTLIRPVAPRPTNIPAAWVPLANAEKRSWTWIVIHHSATPTGGVAAFDKAHKAKGWDGVGYDFVIGNGSDTADGQVEVTYRWSSQAQGAHALTPDERFNKHGIGICLVGNMMDHAPTAKQMRSLEKLVAYLADTYHIQQTNILGHKMTGKQTDCPGSMTDISKIRADVARLRQTAFAEEPTPAPGTELLQTASR